MRRFLFYAIPTAFILLSLLVMVSGNWLKQPIAAHEINIAQAIKELEDLVKEQEWVRAKSKHKQIEEAWHKVSKRVQFSVERETMSNIDASLARIKGGIAGEDQQSILLEIYYFYQLWNSLG